MPQYSSSAPLRYLQLLSDFDYRRTECKDICENHLIAQPLLLKHLLRKTSWSPLHEAYQLFKFDNRSPSSARYMKIFPRDVAT